jgi:hypothetical protein
MSDDHAGRKPNRLLAEKSPYLLQHAYNPVDWYPWGDEAFERARREDRPIFLSIGYSTCHWCHVMERESFEDGAVAKLLNDGFVAIKVDREERPDVDRIYMQAMQAMGMGGGWPLNVFLTPELEPFFGGTYFPPDSKHGRPGMMQLLPRVLEAWRRERAEIEATGARVLAALDSMSRPAPGAADRERSFLSAWDWLEQQEDSTHGGFGSAPKFPSVSNLDYLLRVWARAPERNAEALAMVRRQLDAMRAGGIHDHLGGGFHRYATDRGWLVPHFEKMLYDQAQLACIYLDAHAVTGEPSYAAAARGVFDYVARDLTAPEGAFHSAEDADSEGEEGRFYVWTPQQIGTVLGDARTAALLEDLYGVTPQGNFEGRTTILSEVRSLEEVAKRQGLTPAEAASRLAAARAALLEARAKRPRPHLDDKVLTSWNGLMIAATAKGARVLGEPALAARAARAAAFVEARLWDPRSRSLARRWRDGEAAGAGQLDDHAYYAFGLIGLAQATGDPRWLELAVKVCETMVERFWDEEHGAFFESPAGDPSVKLRLKDGFDGAEIAGNSIAALVLEQLGRLLGRDDWRDLAARTMDHFAARLGDGGAAMPRMLVAFDLARAPVRHIFIAGDPAAADTRALLAEADRRFLPHDLVLVVDGGERQRRFATLMPWIAPLTRQGGRATAYVCIDHACRLPVTEPAAFAAQLDEGRQALTATRETP